MDISKRGIAAENFYGPKSAAQIRIENIVKKSSSSHEKAPSFMKQLLGPSRTWKVFKKQQEAVNCCLERKNGLMCFAFEQNEGQRLFLVAHPKVYWSSNSRRFFKNCSTYEVIQEKKLCKLYLDVEFEYEFNSINHTGDRMLNNFLNIINHNLHDFYGINCGINDILDLDSSNVDKYSHHIIYQIPNVAFENNYAVGNFVRKICEELKQAYEDNVLGCGEKLNKVINKYGVTAENVQELFVTDRKGKTKLFIDEGVYTKNRHFRLLGSTKLGKNSHLRISTNNKYVPRTNDSTNCNVFLDSLITYFSAEVERILEFEGFSKGKAKTHALTGATGNASPRGEALENAYPEIDKFILRLISPLGEIRRRTYFSSSSVIIYDISGYRYCSNIKRHHKSNNIMFVIDLRNLTFYQKCYDPDCADFKSEAVPLPEEVCFGLRDDADLMACAVIGGGEEAASLQEDIFGGSCAFEVELCEILACAEDAVSDADFMAQSGEKSGFSAFPHAFPPRVNGAQAAEEASICGQRPRAPV